LGCVWYGTTRGDKKGRATTKVGCWKPKAKDEKWLLGKTKDDQTSSYKSWEKKRKGRELCAREKEEAKQKFDKKEHQQREKRLFTNLVARLVCE